MGRRFAGGTSSLVYGNASKLLLGTSPAAWTAVCWARCTTTGSYETMFSKGKGRGGGVGRKDAFTMGVDGASSRFQGTGPGTLDADPLHYADFHNTGAATQFPDYQFFCQRYDRTARYTAWMNGTVTKNEAAFNQIDYNPTDTPVSIGCGHNVSLAIVEPFFGDVAECALWERALTDAEVVLLSAGMRPRLAPDNLVFYASLESNNTDEISGDTGTAVSVTTSPTHPAMRDHTSIKPRDYRRFTRTTMRRR